MRHRRCLSAGCDRVARKRGLCGPHYSRLHDRVGSGETTWAALEAAGLCRPAAKRGTGPAPPVPPELVAGYEAGTLSLADVAARLGTTAGTARERLRQQGVDTSRRGSRGRRPAAVGSLAYTAAMLYRGGLTLKQVADRLGVSVEEVCGLVTRAHPTGEGQAGG